MRWIDPHANQASDSIGLHHLTGSTASRRAYPSGSCHLPSAPSPSRKRPHSCCDSRFRSIGCSQAMQADTYVKLRARKALEDLKAHRQRLASELKSINTVLDLSSSIKLIEDEIAVVEAGLVKLDTPTAAWASALGFSSQSSLPKASQACK